MNNLLIVMSAQAGNDPECDLAAQLEPAGFNQHAS
jgi:hypothetical protein